MLKKSREHLNNYHCTSHENGEMVRAAPLSNRRCFAAQGQLETRSQQTRNHQRHPAPTAIQTQSMSKRELRACAYQRTRQRKMGIAKKKILPRLLKTIWQRKAVWKTLFQNKPSGTINPVYLPRKLLNNTKNVSINKTLSLTTHAHDFYPATYEEHPMNNYEPDRVLF